MDGSSLNNLRMARVGGLLKDNFGVWISGFSLNMGITTNNMAKLGAVHQGLILAWELGFKFIQLEFDYDSVLSWLTRKTSSFPLNVFPLICDCTSLMAQAWKVQVHHIYREANESVDTLAKQRNHQQHILTIYDTCPSFA